MGACTSVDLAWAAGLFEGEGSISFRKDRRTFSLSLASTDEDVVLRFQAILGGRVNGPYLHANPKHKPYWNWNLHHQNDAAAALMTLHPLLGERRQDKAEKVLRAWLNRGPRPLLRSHCKRGHPLAPPHLYQNPKTGARQCRTCLLDHKNKIKEST